MIHKQNIIQALRLFALCITAALTTAPASATDFTSIRIVAAEFPPYSYKENGALAGPAIEKVQAILGKLNIDKEIEIYPWPRAYRIGTTQPGTLLFSVARTAKREDLFKWVGRIVHFDVKLFKDSRRKDIQISSLEDLRNYRVGGLIKDVKTDYLTRNGITVETYGDEDSGVRMLLRRRLDLMPADLESMNFRLRKLGRSSDEVTPVYDLTEISRPLYAAFQADTEDAIVKAFSNALDEIGEIPAADHGDAIN